MAALLTTRFCDARRRIERDDRGYLQVTFACDGAPMLAEVRRSGPPELGRVGWIAGNHDMHSDLIFHTGYGETLVEAVAGFAERFADADRRLSADYAEMAD